MPGTQPTTRRNRPTTNGTASCSHPDSTLRLALTEAAVRGLVRRTGDTTPGVIIGRCALEGDVGTPGAPIRVVVTCSLEYPRPILETTDLLRQRIAAALATHTELTVEEVDVVVDDVHGGRTVHG